MISGIGNVIIGDFDTEVLSVCSSSFDLTFEYESYGFDYINSSAKMLQPSIDNFDTKQKSWTLTIDFAIMPKPIWESVLGERQESTDIDTFFTYLINGSESFVIPSGANTLRLYNVTTSTDMVLVASAPSRNEYQIISNEILFNNEDTIYVTAFGAQTSQIITYLSQKIFSYSGIIYTASGEKYICYVPKMQAKTFPSLSLSAQTMSFTVLDEIKIFKL